MDQQLTTSREALQRQIDQLKQDAEARESDRAFLNALGDANKLVKANLNVGKAISADNCIKTIKENVDAVDDNGAAQLESAIETLTGALAQTQPTQQLWRDADRARAVLLLYAKQIKERNAAAHNSRDAVVTAVFRFIVGVVYENRHTRAPVGASAGAAAAAATAKSLTLTMGNTSVSVRQSARVLQQFKQVLGTEFEKWSESDQMHAGLMALLTVAATKTSTSQTDGDRIEALCYVLLRDSVRKETAPFTKLKAYIETVVKGVKQMRGIGSVEEHVLDQFKLAAVHQHIKLIKTNRKEAETKREQAAAAQAKRDKEAKSDKKKDAPKHNKADKKQDHKLHDAAPPAVAAAPAAIAAGAAAAAAVPAAVVAPAHAPPASPNVGAVPSVASSPVLVDRSGEDWETQADALDAQLSDASARSPT